MKLSVGGKEFGEVPDIKVEEYKPKPLIRHEVVQEAIVEGIIRLIRRYISSDSDRSRIAQVIKAKYDSGRDDNSSENRAGTGTVKGSAKTGSKPRAKRAGGA